MQLIELFIEGHVNKVIVLRAATMEVFVYSLLRTWKAL